MDYDIIWDIIFDDYRNCRFYQTYFHKGRAEKCYISKAVGNSKRCKHCPKLWEGDRR